MSPRTYIGPFGRILPVTDGEEPERQQIPDSAIDETRHNMATYQLPPPERLLFGTDLTCGVTEPMRYNTISHSSRTHASPHFFSAEPSNQLRREQLPSVSQLLTPATKSTAPTSSPSPPQRNPDPQQRPRSPVSHNRDSFSDRHTRSQWPVHRSDYLQSSSTTAQGFSQANLSPSGKIHQISQSAQALPSYSHPDGSSLSSYASSFELKPQPSYPLPSQQYAPTAVPYQPQPTPFNASYPQLILSPGVAQPQYMQPLGHQSLSLQPQSGDCQTTVNTAAELVQNQPGPSNAVKPQPRVVGEQDIPGEGPSWVYEDGSSCKKVIDGEAVNAQWGITKAGKPRKRLAIACTTCREKKIKCDPAEPRCVQCEKFNRICKFTTAFRNQRASERSPSCDNQTRTSFISIKPESSTVEDKMSPVLKSMRAEFRQSLKRRKSSPEVKSEAEAKVNKVTAVKKQCSHLPESLASDTKNEDIVSNTSHKCLKDPCSLRPYGQSKNKLRPFDWHNDPFDVDADMCSHYLEAYLDNINSVTYRMFPRRSFQAWVQGSSGKSPQDLITIYAVLAVGSLFSSRPGHRLQGSLLCNVAKSGLWKNDGEMNLQLLHGRFLLSLYYLAIDEQQASCDYSGMAVRAALGLRLNLDSQCQSTTEHEGFTYGLNSYALAECKRRAFWSIYLADRFSGNNFGHSFWLQTGDIHLRLPCEENQYEDQADTKTPFYDNGLLDREWCEVRKQSDLGLMAYSIQILSILSEIITNALRSSQRPVSHYLSDFEAFSSFTLQKLARWVSGLPSYLSETEFNVATHMSQGEVGAFIGIHTIYHTAAIRINRQIRSDLILESALFRSITEAIYHARKLLETLQILEDANKEVQRNCPAADKETYLSTTAALPAPFLGYAILSAVDVLSAGGLLESCEDVINLIETGLAVIDHFKRCWASAQFQSKVIKERLDRLAEAISSKAAASKKAWKCVKPLDSSFGPEQDVFYASHDTNGVRFLRHLEAKIPENGILLVD